MIRQAISFAQSARNHFPIKNIICIYDIVLLRCVNANTVTNNFLNITYMIIRGFVVKILWLRPWENYTQVLPILLILLTNRITRFKEDNFIVVLILTESNRLNLEFLFSRGENNLSFNISPEDNIVFHNRHRRRIKDRSIGETFMKNFTMCPKSFM